MTEKFIDRIRKEHIVDTCKYRYRLRNTPEYSRIERIPREYVGTTVALEPWEVVKTLYTVQED